MKKQIALLNENERDRTSALKSFWLSRWFVVMTESSCHSIDTTPTFTYWQTIQTMYEIHDSQHTHIHTSTHPITHKFLEMKTAKLTHFKYYLFVPWIWLLAWKNEDRITTVDPQHTFKTVIYCVFDISNHNNYRHHSHHPFDIINSNNMNMLASMYGTTERWKDLTSLLFYLFFFLAHYSFSLFLGEIFFSTNIINRCDLH